MKKVMQRYLHNPDEGVHGDCWVACLSSIMDVDIGLFPDPNNKEWNCKDGYRWPLYFNKVVEFIISQGFNYDAVSIPSYKLMDKNMVAIGKSPRGDFAHAVVWNGCIVHDPHPENTGIHSILSFEIISKKQ